MRVLQTYNTHRGFGGADRGTAGTIEVLRQNGVEVEEFARDSRDLPANLRGKITAFAGGLYAAGAVREFTDVLRIRRPDVVHVHELYPLISPWILPRCKAAGIPVVMTCYDYRLSCPIATHHTRGAACHRCLGGREYWCVLRNCRASIPESVAYALRNASARHFGLFDGHVDRFVAISDYQRDFLTGRVGIAAERVVVNPLVIGLPPEPVKDPAQGRYVGFAGRYVHEKGVEVMVEACRRAGLPMRFANADTPSHPAIRPGDDASFVMPKSPAELADFYRGARIIVVPSLWPETMGVVAAEALSHGIPVVASRIGALQETVRDDETGLLFEPGNIADLVDKLRRIWDDPDLARRLGRNGREDVEARFTGQAHFRRLMRIYADLVAPIAANQRATAGTWVS